MNPLPPSLRSRQDSSYFRGIPPEELAFELLDDPAPTGVILAGPSRWDPSREPQCPLLVALKDVRPRRGGHLLWRHGQILAYNPEAGSLVVFQPWSEEGKIPLPTPSESADAIDPSEEPESTIVLLDWACLPSPCGRMPPSSLEVSALFCDTMSNQVPIAIGDPCLSWEEIPSWVALRLPSRGPERSDRRFDIPEGFAFSEAPGILACLTGGETDPDRPANLVVSLSLDPASIPTGALRQDLHLVFVWPGSDRAHHIQVDFPLERARSRGELLCGVVTLDLQAIFPVHPSGHSFLPTDLHLVCLCGPLRWGPQPMAQTEGTPERLD